VLQSDQFFGLAIEVPRRRHAFAATGLGPSRCGPNCHVALLFALDGTRVRGALLAQLAQLEGGFDDFARSGVSGIKGLGGARGRFGRVVPTKGVFFFGRR